MTFGIRQEVFHRRRCLFWNGWFVVIRHQKVSEWTQRTCEKSHPDSSRFLADIVRTLQVGTLGLCRACSSVEVISSELIVLIVFFIWASAIPQNSFRSRSSTFLRRLHQQLDVFHEFPNMLLQHQIFLLQCCCRTISLPRVLDASRQAFPCHIVFQVRFLGNTLHLQPRREPLEFPMGLLILHLVYPSAISWIQLQDLLIRLGSMLAESKIIRSHWCRLLHVVFPYGPNQVSPRVALGYWNIQLSGLVRKFTPVHFCETQERLFLSIFFWWKQVFDHSLHFHHQHPPTGLCLSQLFHQLKAFVLPDIVNIRSRHRRHVHHFELVRTRNLWWNAAWNPVAVVYQWLATLSLPACDLS